EAARIYAAAFSRAPAFYEFVRTLQAYGKFLDESTTLFLPGNAQMLRMLGPAALPPGARLTERGQAAGGGKPRVWAPAVSFARQGQPAPGSAPSDIAPKQEQSPQ